MNMYQKVFTDSYLGISSKRPDEALRKDLDGNFNRNLVMGFGMKAPQGARLFAVPHWFFVLLPIAFATLPWLRCRFSLLTLLIATTLVAVVLSKVKGTGVIVT